VNEMTNSVSATNQSDVYSSLSAPTTAGKSSQSTADAAQKRFLTLLTAQLKNQDPMSPMDSAQMTSQLAQLSTVDGIERLNTNMQIMSGNSGLATSIQAASLVGKDVLVEGEKITLNKGIASGGAMLDGPADDLRVAIKDANGNVVRTLGLGPQSPGIVRFEWDGFNDNGQSVGPGQYHMDISVLQGGKSSKATPLEKNTVMSVTPSKDGIYLNFPSGSRLGMDSIRQFI